MLHISLTKAVERRNVAYTDGVIQEGYPSSPGKWALV